MPPALEPPPWFQAPLPALFISDLHLDENHPDWLEELAQLLNSVQGQAGSTFILGDLFDAWVGDDDPRPLAQQVRALLRQHTAAGRTTALLHGNRDFLLGERFAAETGVTLLPDPVCLQAGPHRLMLSHGDLMCTGDAGYQAFRTQVRSPDWQRAFLARPLDERIAWAQSARAQSRLAQQDKPAELMDVDPDTVRAWMRLSGVDTLIHGHTHRPGVAHGPDGWSRWVIPDWRPDQAGLVWLDQHGPALKWLRGQGI